MLSQVPTTLTHRLACSQLPSRTGQMGSGNESPGNSPQPMTDVSWGINAPEWVFLGLFLHCPPEFPGRDEPPWHSGGNFSITHSSLSTLIPQSLTDTLGITSEINHWLSNALPRVCFRGKLTLSSTLSDTVQVSLTKTARRG